MEGADQLRAAVLDAMKRGAWSETNHAIDKLRTYMRRGGYPPTDGPIKPTAAFRKGASGGVQDDLASLNKLIADRTRVANGKPRSNPGRLQHAIEARDLLAAATKAEREARDHLAGGDARKAFDQGVTAAILISAAAREAEHAQPTQEARDRVARVAAGVEDLLQRLQQSLPRRKSRRRGDPTAFL